ncbi:MULTISPECIES: hypothetical protein [Arcobacteraceae]|uniref:hypothetical protein n=1 Tax=Arcobacteraceae TaxID=2808963 RepID=UPI001D170ACB|nr:MULTISPECIES: hypothetical protein [Arcobacteraceae]
MKNYEEMQKAEEIELYSSYMTDVKNFIEKTMQFVNEHSKTFENERAILLKDANLLQKEKKSQSYSKDKHKHKKFNDEY